MSTLVEIGFRVKPLAPFGVELEGDLCRPGREHLSRRHLQRVTVADVSGEDMLPHYIKLDM